jgi:Holliday junction resolvase RusA-like endonuclease
VTLFSRTAKPAAATAATPSTREGQRPLLEGPLLVEITFWMPRPKGHFGSGKNAGKLKANAPRFHVSAPDVLKLARGVEDACQGLIYRNDSAIVTELLQKPYGEPARCEVRVVPIAQDTVETQHRDLLHEATESAAPMQLPIETALDEGRAA